MNRGLFDFDHDPFELFCETLMGELRSPSGMKSTTEREGIKWRCYRVSRHSIECRLPKLKLVQLLPFGAPIG